MEKRLQERNNEALAKCRTRRVYSAGMDSMGESPELVYGEVGLQQISDFEPQVIITTRAGEAIVVDRKALRTLIIALEKAELEAWD